MGTGVRDKYSVAINGKGYMLRGGPNNPAYRRDEQPTAISRLALSDLQYSDFSGSGTFFTAQTDWSAGIKTDKVWKDDAKFYYSTNIDAYSEPGALKLHKQLSSHNTFNENLFSGTVAEVNGVTNMYVGTDDDAGGYPQVYKYSSGSWSAIAATTFGTGQNAVSQLSGHKGLLCASVVGVGNNWCFGTYNGTSWTDHSSAIRTATGLSASGASRAHCELAGTLYAAIDDSSGNKSAIASTVDAGANWVSKIVHSTDSLIVDMIGYGGMVYYLLVNSSYYADLRVFDPVTNADTSVYMFYNVSYWFTRSGGRYLHNLGGKLIITVPSSEIYSYDGSTMTRIFLKDTAKNNIGTEASVDLQYGGLLVGTKLHWANLVYDGEAFFNSRKDSTDDTSYYYYPLMLDSSNTSNYLGFSGANPKVLLQDSSNYKATLAKNFLVFSEMSPVVAIDKLLYSITIVFDALATNESLAIEYSTNSGSSWTALTTMTPTTEGSNTNREFIIPNSVTYKKVFVRVKMAGTGTTPTVRDVIVAYKPIPNYKNRWSMRLDMSDGIKLLSGQNDPRKGIELYSDIWNEKNSKQIVTFEDVDYIECSITSGMAAADTSARVNSTKNFPRRGRIRAVSGGVAEEMVYTSAESNIIKGITRGQRGTRARAYSAGQVLSNAYSVYIERVQSEINWTDENKSEHVATVTLLEA